MDTTTDNRIEETLWDLAAEAVARRLREDKLIAAAGRRVTVGTEPAPAAGAVTVRVQVWAGPMRSRQWEFGLPLAAEFDGLTRVANGHLSRTSAVLTDPRRFFRHLAVPSMLEWQTSGYGPGVIGPH